MKYLVSFLLLFCGLSAFSQADTIFVLGAEFGATTEPTDSTFTVDIVHPTDQLGQAFTASKIQVGYRLIDVFGRLYRVKSVDATGIGSSILTVVELQNGSAPSGTGLVYRKPDNSDCIPEIQTGDIGISYALAARVANHNAVNGCVNTPTASDVIFTPVGNIQSSNVQNMGEELDEAIRQLTVSQNTGVVGFDTKAIMDTTLNTYSTNTLARLANDPVLSNNGYYRFNGTAWVFQANLYASDIVVDDEVDAVNGKAVYDFGWTSADSPTALTSKPLGTDLVDYYNIGQVVGYVRDVGTFSTGAGFERTGYVPIPAGVRSITYRGNWLSAATYLAFYNESFVFISNVAKGASTTVKTGIVVPAGAKYVVATTSGSGGSSIIEIESEQFFTDVYDQIDATNATVTANKVETDALELGVHTKLGIAPGTDLVDLQEVATITGGYINSSGGVTTNAGWDYIDYVDLKGATQITYIGNWNNGSIYLAFYNESKTYISNVARGASNITVKSAIAVPATARYVRASAAAGVPIEIRTDVFTSTLSTDVNEVFVGMQELSVSPGDDLIERQEIDTIQGSYISSTGTLTYFSGFYTCDYTQVTGQQSITYSGEWLNAATYLAFYDINKDTVQVVSIAEAPGTTFIRPNIPVPAGAVYVRAGTVVGSTLRILADNYSSVYVNEYPDEQKRINDALGSKADTSIVYKVPADYVTPSSYADPWLKMPNFFEAWVSKTEDCDVVLVGTSITQGSTSYAGTRADAATRPIYCEANSLAGYVFDKLRVRWDNQFYRRYDSGYFTEAGTWANKTSDATWDDGSKIPLTRASTSANASVQFVVPIDSWAFRFVFKSETTGDDCTVTVAEGNSQLQVWNGTTWVEANGYTFTTAEVHDPTPAGALTYGDYSLGKGNTTYGKLVKFRSRNSDGSFDTRVSAKTVTITKSSDTGKRLTYWGVEWSKRANMLSVRNAGRGSNSWDGDPPGAAGSSTHMYQNDITYFNPDLVLFEINHNSYGATTAARTLGISNYVFNKQLNGDTANIALSLSEMINFDTVDVAFFNITDGGGALGVNYDSDGNLIANTITAGQLETSSDARDGLMYWMRANHPTFLFADSHNALREAAIKYYGNMKAAMTPSSALGYTLMNDQVHPNKRGYEVLWRAIEPIFSF